EDADQVVNDSDDKQMSQNISPALVTTNPPRFALPAMDVAGGYGLTPSGETEYEVFPTDLDESALDDLNSHSQCP
ncbi:Hypothetical protein FKW44_015036, partial [Caligus rogercresseyi]